VTTESEQYAPNAFETAILRTMAREHPSLLLDTRDLRILSRKYTGIGSYTDFDCDGSEATESFNLKAPIGMPGVPNGLGAVLFCRGRRPSCLETFTHGEVYWTGASEGFSVG
jgi:hypothetical protein